MSNRQEVIAKAVENLEEAVFVMSDNSENPSASDYEKQETDRPEPEPTELNRQRSQAKNQQPSAHAYPRRTIVGGGRRKIPGLFKRWGRKKQKSASVIQPANMAEV